MNDDDRDSDSGGELHVMDRGTGKPTIRPACALYISGRADFYSIRYSIQFYDSINN